MSLSAGGDSYYDQLRDRFEAVRSPARVAGFRLSRLERSRVEVGVRDNRVGDVHNPVAISRERGGSFLLEWDDGRLSSGPVDGGTLENFDELLPVLYRSRYEDKDAPVFLGASCYPVIRIYSREISEVVDSGGADLLKIIGRAQDFCDRYKVRNMSGRVRAEILRTGVDTSQGLAYRGKATVLAYSFIFDGDMHGGFSRRAPFSTSELDAQLNAICGYLPHLAKDASGFESDSYPVLLHPNVVEALISAYLVENLNGAHVAHGSSPFSMEDFSKGRRIFRSDIQLGVDPLTDFSTGSYRATREGVPSRKTDYIRDGRLVSPILNLKYARRFGLSATAAPAGIEGVIFRSGKEIELKTALERMDPGVHVLHTLGVHTQDPRRGDYSLTVPQGLGVKKGRYTGRLRLTINGNFFDHLNSEETVFVRFPAYHLSGMLVKSRCLF